MTDPGKAKERLEKLAGICLSFPKTVQEDKGSHSSFKVSKKVFVYFVNNHHGDGIVGLWCKVLPGDNERLIAASPQKFYMPDYVGPRGWVALRLDRRTVDWAEVTELVRGSYAQTAPKSLARIVDGG